MIGRFLKGLPIAAVALALAANAAWAGKANDTLVWTTDREAGAADPFYDNIRELVIIGHTVWDGLLFRNLDTGEYEPDVDMANAPLVQQKIDEPEQEPVESRTWSLRPRPHRSPAGRPACPPERWARASFACRSACSSAPARGSGANSAPCWSAHAGSAWTRPLAPCS